MIHYYTNREISEKLGINLARWKRWSRSFLPPDPLGGMQSGYARQYVFEDLFKVFLGGHLLSHLKLPVPDSQQVLADLSPWLKKNGFFDLNGANGIGLEKAAQSDGYRIYFSPLSPVGAKGGSGFRYLIRKTVGTQSEASATFHQIMETYEETIIHSDVPDGIVFLQDSSVRMINLTALFAVLLEKLRH
ncbi:MAG: hypothetical protein HGJ94_02835 [Desulfosarcina sp.]|nr:hypothetical protein [Desulfosarcina sp.]MBC2742267.1 hypothetical protein [Desulfosarcina sp.]MBC2765179.1 hypothetical protein [Desulfosarcina sp.]